MKQHKRLLALALGLLPFLGLQAQTPDTQVLTAPKQFTGNCEGPATDAQGTLYAVNLGQDGTIARLHMGSTQPELFLTLPEGSIGNGIRLDRKGNLYVADFLGHKVYRIHPETRKATVLVHEPRMNQPNDLAIADNGMLFASDPHWGSSTGQIWRITPQGVATLLESGMGTTNGIEVSPDNRRLYVNESVQRNVWVYDLDEQGNISNKRLFHHFEDFGMDGMRCDVKGNLYVTRYGKGAVAVLSPQGKLLREIHTHGKNTSNVTFGGRKGKTIYITLQDAGNIEVYQNKIRGAR